MTMLTRLLLSQSHWETMRSHVDSCAPIEACGLLAGVGHAVHEVMPMANREESPSRFRMDAVEQLRAFRLIEEHGMELLGIFHSHPAADSAATGPSATDIQEAAYPTVHVIWSRHAGKWRAGGFWIEDGRVSDVPLDIVPGE